MSSRSTAVPCPRAPVEFIRPRMRAEERIAALFDALVTLYFAVMPFLII